MSRPISTESVFRAMAHITRRGIVELLMRRPTSAGDIAAHFRHSRPVLSKHVRILHQAGLIAYERQGVHLLYRLVPGAFEPLHHWVSKLPRESRGNSTRSRSS